MNKSEILVKIITHLDNVLEMVNNNYSEPSIIKELKRGAIQLDALAYTLFAMKQAEAARIDAGKILRTGYLDDLKTNKKA